MDAQLDSIRATASSFNTHIRGPCMFRLSFGRALGVVTLLSVGIPPLAEAVPITINATNVWRADRTPNPIGFLPTALVPWIDVHTSAGDVSLTSVTASVAGNTYNLQRIATGALQGLYFAQIPYDPALTGPWTITATNGTNVVTSTRPAFVPVAPMPFVDDIDFSGTGNDITVHWTVADEVLPQLVGQQVAIWDLSSNPTPTTVQFFDIPVAQRQLALNTLGLTLGTTYAVEINNLSRNATTGFIDAFSGNWLSGWTPTTGEVQLPASVPEPGTLTLLLTGLAGAAFRRRRAAGTA